jgi:hypothetical protein
VKITADVRRTLGVVLATIYEIEEHWVEKCLASAYHHYDSSQNAKNILSERNINRKIAHNSGQVAFPSIIYSPDSHNCTVAEHLSKQSFASLVYYY